jgi:metallo-beta-lactamase family protein
VPALPLYTENDARACLTHFTPVDFDIPVEVLPEMFGLFRRSGHLLGAASVRIECAATSILFSGDLGRPGDPMMLPPAAPPRSDYIVIESTYGDRRHDPTDPQRVLGDVIRRAYSRGGVVLIPSFAVGRAQLLLLHIARLRAAAQVPDVPVFLDSPMAIDATALLTRFRSEHRLDDADLAAMHRLCRVVRTPEESRNLDRLREPAIIISANGMATGGRVVHHLKVFAPDARNIILFAGFQAAGTRGAALVAGATTLRIHGETFPVRAEVAQIGSLSAHADADELLAWLQLMPGRPRQTFITHGEAAASDTLRKRIERELGGNARVPEYRDEVDLT